MDDADKRLATKIRIQRSLGIKGDNWDNYAVARDVLHEELGYHGDEVPQYNLREETRDILLAHARQDASHALANTTSLLTRVAELRRLVYLLIVAVVGLALVVLFKRIGG